MSSTEPSPSTKKPFKRKHNRSKPVRSLSASEIARNLKSFEIWSTHQRCEQVSYSDIPRDLKPEIDEIFQVTRRLPLAWTNKASRDYQRLKRFSSPAFLDFILDAYKQTPALFSDDVDNCATEILGLYAEISVVFTAWQKLCWMKKSKEKWSEADYAANVYNVFRSSAIKESSHRVQCSISLAQPLLQTNIGPAAERILNTKTVVPDCTVLIPAIAIRSLSLSAKSPFKVLKAHPTVVETGNASKGSSFRYQSTPCVTLPDSSSFEFASSFWEDKKPVHHLLEDAYRQNRMSTTSALRHLHSLSIKAPVFGLVWSHGIVRAHVDWCKAGDDSPESLFILSAPYQGEFATGELFHEWQLHQPSDILSVYFLIRNLDRWTNNGFHTRVVHGVQDLVDKVINKGEKYTPWKRIGELTHQHAPLTTVTLKENTNLPAYDSSYSTPPKGSIPHRHRR